MKNWLIRKFELKGSWSWAKKQLKMGKIVRCKHWGGSLKYKIDSEKNGLLQANFTSKNEPLKNGVNLWETSNHFLEYEDFTDYEIFEWQ